MVFSNNIFLSVHILLCCLRPFHHVRLWRCDCKIYIKHCQRQKGPQGCLLSPKELLLSYVTSWSKFSFRISIKLQLPNLDQTSGSKSWPNFNFKILIKSQPQSLDLKHTSKSWSNFSFNIVIKTRYKISTKPQLQNIDQTVVNTFLSINISNTTNIKKLWVGIFKGQSHISQVY